MKLCIRCKKQDAVYALRASLMPRRQICPDCHADLAIERLKTWTAETKAAAAEEDRQC